MHDGMQQFLAGISMQLEVAQGSVDMGRDASPALQAARKLLLNLREDFRHCVNALRHTEAEMDLPAVLEQTSAIIRACHPVQTQVEVKGETVRLPGKAVASLMLIVQEAARNAVLHGEARLITLGCHFASSCVTVEVHDDGRGFDCESVTTAPHRYGLHNMRGRMAQIGGSLQIQSEPGKGTRITASLPLPLLSS